MNVPYDPHTYVWSLQEAVVPGFISEFIDFNSAECVLSNSKQERV